MVVVIGIITTIAFDTVVKAEFTATTIPDSLDLFIFSINRFVCSCQRETDELDLFKIMKRLFFSFAVHEVSCQIKLF